MMDQQTQLGSAALMVATGVLVAMYLMKDAILATVALPSSAKERLRLGYLKLRGLEEYAGRHRA